MQGNLSWGFFGNTINLNLGKGSENGPKLLILIDQS
jgi:hypothetical protein